MEVFDLNLETAKNIYVYNQVRMGMRSFLAFTILTVVNLVLIFINISFSIPFSFAIPQVIVGTALYEYSIEVATMYDVVTNIFISFMLIAVFIMLYCLGNKHKWPLIVTLILVFIDTLFLIAIAGDNLYYLLLDIATHLWIIRCLINVIRKRNAILRTSANL